MKVKIIEVLTHLQTLNLISDWNDEGDQITFHTTGSETDIDDPINLKVVNHLQMFGDKVQWNDCGEYEHEGTVFY